MMTISSQKLACIHIVVVIFEKRSDGIVGNFLPQQGQPTELPLSKLHINLIKLRI